MSSVQLSANYFFDGQQASEAGAAKVGGKAYQLALLHRYGLPVPISFVIPDEVCRALLPEQLWVDAINAAYLEDATKNEALDDIQQRILQHRVNRDFQLALSEFLATQHWQTTALAVRSSAPGEDSQQHSFAGIHSSELNVIGQPAIEAAILKVLASLWTVQACAYREKIQLPHQDAAMAIVLMPMLKSEIAGVIFTCDPRDGREDRLLISSVRGLAESLVAGTVDGEDIIVQRDWSCQQWRIAHRRTSNARHVVEANEHGGLQQRELSVQERNSETLSDERAIALAKIAIDTANAFDYSKRFLDIEWVFDGVQFYLVQARPISARNVFTYPQIADQKTMWSNGNTKEILPFALKISELDVMLVAVNEMLGVPHRVVDVTPLVGGQRCAIFNGYTYLNASLIQWEIYQTFNVAPQEVNFILGGHQACIQVPPRPFASYGKLALNMLKAIVRFPSYRRRGMQEAAEVAAQSQVWRQQDLALCSDQELLDELLDRARNTYLRYTGLCIMQGASGTLMNVQKILNKKFPNEGQSLTSAIMTEGEKSISAQQVYDLMQLAKLAASDPVAKVWLTSDSENSLDLLAEDSQFRSAYETFLSRYGHRGNYESYLSRPTWREQADTLKQAILSLGEVDVDALERRQQQQAAWAWEKIHAKTKAPERCLLKFLLKQSKTECNQRELARSSFALMLERSRHLMLELGRRFAQLGILQHSEDIFHLNCAEIQAIHLNALSPSAIQYRIADRKQRIAVWENIEAEDVIYEQATGVGKSNTPLHTQAGDAGQRNRKSYKLKPTDQTWQGIAVSMGCYQGKIRRITHPSQIGVLQQGEILLAPYSDPSWLPLFLKAGGVVVETGGYLSHSAIVARELAIPTVVNLPGILEILNDGDEILIDGPAGTVTRLNCAAPAMK